MFVVHATKKLLDRLRERPTAPVHQSTNALGAWYATALFWRPQIALFVNEATLLPVFVPLAPAATVVDRFPNALRVILQAYAVERSFLDNEIAGMTEHQVAKTASRSVVGIMNEFTFLASYRLRRRTRLTSSSCRSRSPRPHVVRSTVDTSAPTASSRRSLRNTLAGHPREAGPALGAPFLLTPC